MMTSARCVRHISFSLLIAHSYPDTNRRMSVLLTLPPHLIEKIEAILEADLQDDHSFSEDTRRGLRKARDEYQSWTPPTTLTLQSAQLTEDKTALHTDTEPTSQPDDEDSVAEDPPAPPTVDEEVLVSLSRWAGTNVGQVILKRNRIGGPGPLQWLDCTRLMFFADPLGYSMISLLAGTEVYIPPSQLARLRAADNPEKVSDTILSTSEPSSLVLSSTSTSWDSTLS